MGGEHNRPFSIWLIDDDWKIQAQVRKFTEGRSYNLQVFTHSTHIREAIEGGSPRPDLVLIDDEPHGEPTWTLTQDLRTRFGRDILIFCLCGDFNANFRQVSRRIGIDGWLDRPVNIRNLGALCDQIHAGLPMAHSGDERIHFDVKMGRLGLSYWNETVFCSGTLNQYAEFERISNIVPQGKCGIVVDWAQVDQVNIQGVRAWFQHASSNFGSQRHYHFRRVPLVLLEYIKLMPEQFGTNVTLETVHVPMSSNLQDEFERALVYASTKRKKQGPRSVLSPTRQPQFIRDEHSRELAYHPNLNSLIELATAPTDEPMCSEYLNFLHGTLRHALTEFFIARETLLDQVSQICARFWSFHAAASSLGVTPPDPPTNREDMLDAVFEAYRPILNRLLAAERIVHCLRLKANLSPGSSPHTLEARRLALTELTGEFQIRGFDRSYEAMVLGGVLEAEPVYNIDPSAEHFEQLLLAGFRAVGALLSELTPMLNQLGVQVLEQVRDMTTTDQFVVDTHKGLEGKEFDEETLLRFLNVGLLSWRPERDFSVMLDQSRTMCIDHTYDMTRIMQSLSVHDEVQQILEHRRIEMILLDAEGKREDLLQLIEKHAVTLFEKKLVALCYPETRPRLDRQVNQDLVFFGSSMPPRGNSAA